MGKKLSRVLSVTISGWTTVIDNISLLAENGRATTVDNAKVIRFHTENPRQLEFIREALVTMERDWSGINMSSCTDSGDLTLKYDVSKYSLAEVVQLVKISADRVSRAFVAIH